MDLVACKFVLFLNRTFSVMLNSSSIFANLSASSSPVWDYERLRLHAATRY